MLITKVSHHTIHTGGSALSLHSRHKTGHGIGNLRESRITYTSVPPRSIHSGPLQQGISHHNLTLFYREDRLPGMGKIHLFLRTFFDFIHSHSLVRRNRSGKLSTVSYPHLHGDARFASLLNHLLRHIVSRIVAHIVAFSFQYAALGRDIPTQALLQKRGKAAPWFGMIVTLLEIARTVKLRPTGKHMVVAAIRNAVGKDSGCRTLVSQTVGSIPSDAVTFETKITELDVVAVDIHIIKEQSCTPRSHCSTIPQRFITITLYEGIRTSSTETSHKIVHALF